MGLRRLLAGVALVTLALVAVILWVYPSPSDFAASNPYWNGLQRFAAQPGVAVVRSAGLLPASAAGTVLVVIPYAAPFPGDLEAYRRYLAGGGVLILMDDFGAGNEVLAGLGGRARFSGQVLVDPLFNHLNGRFPRIFDFSASPLAEGVAALVLNHPTAISDPGGLSVVARSSPVSFLDANENGRRDQDEPGGPFAVAAAGRAGGGWLVLVSDPSVLLNSMLDLGQNRRFVQNLFGFAGPSPRVYLDTSFLPRAPLDVAKDRLARFREFAATPPVVFAAVVAALVLPLAVLARSPRR